MLVLGGGCKAVDSLVSQPSDKEVSGMVGVSDGKVVVLVVAQSKQASLWLQKWKLCLLL